MQPDPITPSPHESPLPTSSMKTIQPLSEHITIDPLPESQHSITTSVPPSEPITDDGYYHPWEHEGNEAVIALQTVKAPLAAVPTNSDPQPKQQSQEVPTPWKPLLIIGAILPIAFSIISVIVTFIMYKIAETVSSVQFLYSIVEFLITLLPYGLIVLFVYGVAKYVRRFNPQYPILLALGALVGSITIGSVLDQLIQRIPGIVRFTYYSLWDFPIHQYVIYLISGPLAIALIYTLMKKYQTKVAEPTTFIFIILLAAVVPIYLGQAVSGLSSTFRSTLSTNTNNSTTAPTTSPKTSSTTQTQIIYKAPVLNGSGVYKDTAITFTYPTSKWTYENQIRGVAMYSVDYTTDKYGMVATGALLGITFVTEHDNNNWDSFKAKLASDPNNSALYEIPKTDGSHAISYTHKSIIDNSSNVSFYKDGAVYGVTIVGGTASDRLTYKPVFDSIVSSFTFL